MPKIRAGIIGCGKISGIYCSNLTGAFADRVKLVGCADMVRERAEAAAKEYGLEKVLTPEEMLADPEIDIIINLTIPNAHYEICVAAVEAGKHTYVEKPLCITREQAADLLAKAKRKGVLVGGAPDTFLGGGIQTCRKLIDDGVVGEPVAATAFMLGHGHESWHPAPEFYYKTGGGPMFDMGPYYLTALVNLIGPARRVTGSTRITFPERTITSEPLNGTKITVDVPTHIAGVIDFHNGAVGTIVTSFDVWGGRLPFIEVYGTEASLSVPNPNTFGGPVMIKKSGRSSEWEEITMTHTYTENSRGLGVADMAKAVSEGRAPRASGELAAHVLEIMHGFHDASDQGKHYELKTTCNKPEPLPADF
jgi:predicted dehydrogenase